MPLCRVCLSPSFLLSSQPFFSLSSNLTNQLSLSLHCLFFSAHSFFALTSSELVLSLNLSFRSPSDFLHHTLFASNNLFAFDKMLSRSLLSFLLVSLSINNLVNAGLESPAVGAGQMMAKKHHHHVVARGSSSIPTDGLNDDEAGFKEIGAYFVSLKDENIQRRLEGA